MIRAKQAIVLAAGGLALAGCQSMNGNSRQINAGIRLSQEQSGRSFAERQLAAGRAALTERNYATAIAALREAALEPEFSAAASNGLGVAYAGIGRNDLAERYFKQAAAQDPSNGRYEDNLVRFYRARLMVELARRDRIEKQEARLALAETEAKAAAVAAGMQTDAPARRMVRLGQSEVLIRSMADQPAAPRMVVVEQNPVKAKAVELPATPLAADSSTSLVPATAPVEPKPASRKLAVAIEGRREVFNQHVGDSSEPAALTITTTGRRYEAPRQAVHGLALTSPLPEPDVQAVKVPTFAATFVRQDRVHREIFSQGEAAQSIASLAVAVE